MEAPLLKLFDSHCHLDDAAFAADRSEVLQRAHQAGVLQMVVPAYSAPYWARLQSLCASGPDLHPAYGIHPGFVTEDADRDLRRLEAYLPEAVAIGEIGLDRWPGAPDLALQQRFLTQQLAMAQAAGLPVILHARHAVEDVLLTLRRFPGVRGVVHSFAGSDVQARQLIGLGFLLGFGGAVTYPRARRLRALVSGLPATAILLETDAPYQPLWGHPGERNEPALLAEILNTVAGLRGESARDLAAITTANARTLFSISAQEQPA